MQSTEVKSDSKQGSARAKSNKGCFLWTLCVFLFVLFIGLCMNSIWGTAIGCAGSVFMLLAIYGDKKQTATSDTQETDSESEAKVLDVQSNNQQDNTQSSSKKRFYENISREYFDIIHEYGQKYVEFKNEISINADILDQLEISIQVEEDDDPSLLEPEKQVLVLLSADLYRIFWELGYDMDTDLKESFGLVYLISCMMGVSSATYESIPEVYDEMFDLVTDHLLLIEDFVEDNRDSGYLFSMGPLLGNVDRDWEQKYYIMLYRYASIIAKADGTVTEQESSFLRSIIQLKKSVEKNEKQEKDTTSVNNYTEKDPMVQLQELVGLNAVKEEVATLVNFITVQKMRRSQGLKLPSVSYHCIFTGNPGTGKTTVARILAKTFKQLGILERGHLIETDRSGLVGEYVGQTAVKTNKVIDSALDGVLFIDEAYSLVNKDSSDYGKEVIATLLKRMEDDRNRLIVILAGYTDEMQQFINSNPGLQSRFNRFIKFEDYTEDELCKIFITNIEKYEYSVTNSALEKLKRLIHTEFVNKDFNFGNARWVRNVFEKTLEAQANRLAALGDVSKRNLIEIVEQDIIS